MRGVNKLIIVGNVGRDPEIRSTKAGKKIASFSVATSEQWKDQTGDRKERTQWHRIVVYNENLAKMVEQRVRKGSRLYVEGQCLSRKYTDKDGIEREIFEVVISAFRGDIQLLDKAEGTGRPDSPEEYGQTKSLGEHYREGPGKTEQPNAYAAVRDGATPYQSTVEIDEPLDDDIPL